MAGKDTIGEIFDALEDTDSERFLGGPDVKAAAYAYQRVIEKYIPGKLMDNTVAAVSQYGIACCRAGFEDGFKTAWQLFTEMEFSRQK